MRTSALISLVLGLGAGVLVYILVWHKPDLEKINPKPPSKSAFTDVAAEAGITFHMAFLPKEQGEKFKINLYDHGCGLAVGDFDGDGFDDIYFVNQLGPNALYRNKGDGTFVDVTQEAGVALGDRICVGATFADYDNDGRADLFVTSTRGGNVLFKNLAQGKFKDVTKEAGVSLVAHCQTGAFLDYDNDGLLDLFVTCTAEWTSNQFDAADRYYPGPPDFWVLAASKHEKNVLFRNNGNGTFTDVTAKAKLEGKGWGGDIAYFDYNGDGRLDLLVTNMFGASQLYRNEGKGAFTDVTEETLGRTSWGAIGSKAFDYNNDGHFDLLIVDMHSDMWGPFSADPEIAEFARKNEKKRFNMVRGPADKSKKAETALEKKFADTFQIKYDKVIFGNTFFKNLGNGQFAEETEKANLETFWPWGIATGDFDNDGFEDVFLPSGMGYPFFYWPNRLMMNNGDETFSEQSLKLGIEPPRLGVAMDKIIGETRAPRSSRCAAVADFRGVGRLDIVTNNFNDHPYYFQNNLTQRNYIAFQLQGTKSNRDAIGAVVRLHRGKEIMVRQVHPAGGYLSQSSRKVHFGLGDNTNIDRVEILWPSGILQKIDNPAVNRLHSVTETAS